MHVYSSCILTKIGHTVEKFVILYSHRNLKDLSTPIQIELTLPLQFVPGSQWFRCHSKVYSFYILIAPGILSYFPLFSTKISEALKHVGVCVCACVHALLLHFCYYRVFYKSWDSFDRKSAHLFYCSGFLIDMYKCVVLRLVRFLLNQARLRILGVPLTFSGWTNHEASWYL